MSALTPYVPTNPYVSLDDVVEELKLNPVKVGSNLVLINELLGAIDRASRWVDEYTRRDYFFHDFSATPLALDQFTPGIYGKEIFFQMKPIIGIDKLILGASPTDSAAVQLVYNQDFFFDQNRIYMLDTCQFFLLNIDIPHDGAHQIGNRHDPGWRLSRPSRILWVYGKSGFVQSKNYPMIVAGDTVPQTSGWKINSYSPPPTTLYWTVRQVNASPAPVITVNVYADVGASQLLMSGNTPNTGGGLLLLLAEQNNSGMSGQMFLNYQSDEVTIANQTLTVDTNQPALIDTTSIPEGIESRITTATRLVAASFSGHNRKEVVGLDGSKKDIADREIPPTVFKLLGRRAPILV